MTNIRDELLDELLAGAKTQEEVFGPNGVLKRLTAAVVQRALGAELEHHLGQEKQQQPTLEPRNRRNGKSHKMLQTEHGPVPIDVPRDRLGNFEPQIVPKHARRVAPLDDKILALYARGMSVRDIQAHLEELYATEVSPALISSVTEGVWDEIRSWQGRPLERCYAVVWLDALFVKMRDQGVVQTKAVYVAIGLRLDGRREVLGLWIDAAEGAKFWMRVLAELRSRGVQDILVCCCDGLKGFPQAIEATFSSTVVQTCIVHQVRYSLSFVGWRDRRAVAAKLRAIYNAESASAAEHALEDFDREWGARYPMIAKSWRASWAQLTAFLDFPPELRRMIYTTNAIESLNYQFRKIIKTKGHFPDGDATTKILFLALRNIEKKWSMPVPHWHRIFNQLIAFFGEERLNVATRESARAQNL
jgi:putative transposase